MHGLTVSSYLTCQHYSLSSFNLDRLELIIELLVAFLTAVVSGYMVWFLEIGILVGTSAYRLVLAS